MKPSELPGFNDATVQDCTRKCTAQPCAGALGIPDLDALQEMLHLTFFLQGIPLRIGIAQDHTGLHLKLMYNLYNNQGYDLQAVGRLLEFASDAKVASLAGRDGTDAEGAQLMEADMSLTGSAQVTVASYMFLDFLQYIFWLAAEP